MGGAVAILMMAPLISGLFLLLRDVFGALILPFSFLFGMAGRTEHAAPLGQVVGGMGSDLLNHPVRALAAALLCALSTGLFLLARGGGARMMLGGAALAAILAGWLGGPAIYLVLLPGLSVECLCLLRPITRT
ncbi:putative membrane protein [Gluconacetobacter diazotrophicus PA1 5]|nr:putative membrane protein [Gluconacetobacter diazotrophicus PA1 5]